jgi:hypothetical protein
VPQDVFSGDSHHAGDYKLQQGGSLEYGASPQQGLLHLVKERGTDERFWTFFHQDWYRSVLYLKSSPVVKQQYVDIEYLRNKNDMHFNMILEACDLHGITDLLKFRYNWNQEIISEFYSTLFYDKKERIFMGMTNGRRFHVKLVQFAHILGLSYQLDIPKKLHS